MPDLSVLLALLVVAALVYSASLFGAQFLNIDDELLFGRSANTFNPQEQAAALADGLGRIWDPSQTIVNAYLPVSHTSLWIDYQCFGRDGAFGARVHSLLLHVLVAFVLARLLGRLGLTRGAACIGGLLFLLHPALVESSAWVASRKDVLAGLFTLLALDATWVASRASQDNASGARPAQRAAPVLAVLCAVLALYSKGTAVVLPLLALPILWTGTSSRARRVGLGLALFAVAVAAGLHHTMIAVGEGTLVSGSAWERLTQMPGAFAHYLTTALWPTGLNVFYPEVQTLEAFRAEFWGSLVILGLFAAAVVLAWRVGRRLTAVGLILFGLALLPFNTAFPASVVAAHDRYLYLAIPGLALAIVAMGRRVGPAIGAALVIPLAIAAGVRAGAFHDSGTLWASSLAVESDNSVAHYNYAQHLLTAKRQKLVLVEEHLLAASAAARYPQHKLRAEFLLITVADSDGRVEGALGHAARAVEAFDELPEQARTADQGCEILMRAARQARLAGDLARARSWLARARELGPNRADVLAFAASAALGESIDAEGQLDPGSEAAKTVRGLLDRAAEDPRSAWVYEYPLARAEYEAATGSFMAAERHYRDAIALSPTRSEAHLGRAQVYLGRGLYEGAEAAIADAHELGARDDRLHYLRGLALGGLGQLDRAARFYEAYLISRPNDVAARRALGAVLSGQAMRDLYRQQPEALAKVANRITDLDPENPKLNVIRAVVKRHERDLQTALVLLEQAREDLPGDEEVERLYAETLRDRGYQCRFEGLMDRADDHFVQFLQHAPALGLPTEAVSNMVLQSWRRHYGKAREALAASELDTAEAELRRCLELIPDDAMPRLHLGFVFYERGGEALHQALAEFRAFADGRREVGADPALGVLYEVQTLRRLERLEDALALTEKYLTEPQVVEAAAEPSVDQVRIRAIQDAVMRDLGR